MLLAAAVLLVGLPARPAFADLISMTLGAAGNFAVLQTGNGNVSLANASNAGFITGDVGLNGGNVSDSGVPITGDVFFGNAATGLGSLTGLVSGSITLNQPLLTTAANNAQSASTTFAALGATLPNTSITGTTTINLASGVNVADLTTVNLGNGQVLTLNGAAGSEVIFNVTSGVTLNSGKIVLTGGLTANDIVFNVTGGNVATSGGLNNESVLTGTFLDLNGNVMLTPGALTGQIISGQNINIASGGSVSGPTPAPVSDGGLTLVLLGGALVGLEVLRRVFSA